VPASQRVFYPLPALPLGNMKHLYTSLHDLGSALQEFDSALQEFDPIAFEEARRIVEEMMDYVPSIGCVQDE